MAKSHQKTTVKGLRLFFFTCLTFTTITYWSQTTYYSKSTGNLNLTSTWGLNTDGTGSAPTNFTANNRIYIITNRTTATIGGNWTVSGTNSKVQVGNSSTAINFTIPITVALTGTVDVTNTATLTLLNATIPTFGNLSTGSTVNYARAGNQTVRNTVYYNLIISGSGIKSLANTTSTSITNSLIINSGIMFALNTSNTLSCTINGSVTGTGAIRGGNNSNLIINGAGNLGTLTFSTTLSLHKFSVNRTGAGSLTLGSNLTVTNAFNHSNGIINLNGRLLTLNNSITFPASITNGAFTGTSTSSLTIGGTGAVSNSLFMTQTSSTTKSMSSIILNRAGSTLTLGNPLDIINVITPTSGTVSSNGNLTLKATSAGVVARIGIIGAAAAVTGNVTAESFASGGLTGWTLLGSAGITGRTLADWNDDFTITCSSCPNGSVADGVPFTSITSYNEAAGGTYSNTARYVDATSITNPITPGKGYWVYLGNAPTTSSNIIFDVTGPVNQGNKTINLSYTPTGGGTAADWGYNLISNPYPSPISWSALRATSTQSASISNAIYVYNPDLAGYASFVSGVSNPAVGSGGIGNMIPAGQGFYVKVSGNATLNPREANKAASTQVLLKTNQAQTSITNPQLIRIKIDGENMHNETAIYFDANAHSYFEPEYDAPSLGVDYGMLEITSDINDTLYSINCIEALTNNMSIPIRVTSGTTGSYQIYADDFLSLPSGACLTLHDNITNTDHNLRSGPYICSINNTETTSRFVLNININNNISVISSKVDPSCSKSSDGFIIANSSSLGTFDYFWKDSTNQIIKTSLNKTIADTLTNIDNGYYSVDIANSGLCSNGSQNFQLSTQNNITAFFTPSTTNAVLVNDTTIVNFSNSSLNADSYYWDFGNGDESNLTSPSTMYTENGDYEVILYAINSACGDTTTYITNINVTGSSVTTTIKEIETIASNNILINRDKDGYFVQFNFSESSNAQISVWNILGEKICDDILIKDAKDNKVYISTGSNRNNLLIITASSDNGETGYRKIIND